MEESIIPHADGGMSLAPVEAATRRYLVHRGLRRIHIWFLIGDAKAILGHWPMAAVAVDPPLAEIAVRTAVLIDRAHLPAIATKIFADHHGNIAAGAQPK